MISSSVSCFNQVHDIVQRHSVGPSECVSGFMWRSCSSSLSHSNQFFLCTFSVTNHMFICKQVLFILIHSATSVNLYFPQRMDTNFQSKCSNHDEVTRTCSETCFFRFLASFWVVASFWLIASFWVVASFWLIASFWLVASVLVGSIIMVGSIILVGSIIMVGSIKVYLAMEEILPLYLRSIDVLKKSESPEKVWHMIYTNTEIYS